MSSHKNTPIPIRNNLSIFHPYFDIDYDTALDPAGGSNIDATCINAFYFVDKVHD